MIRLRGPVFDFIICCGEDPGTKVTYSGEDHREARLPCAMAAQRDSLLGGIVNGYAFPAKWLPPYRLFNFQTEIA